MKIAEGGLSWVVPSFSASFLLIFLTFYIDEKMRFMCFFISMLSLAFSSLLLLFFRDPDRETGEDVVAVADGVVREISKGKDDDVGEYIRISTFMNFYNVHVNRMPIDGTIEDMVHLKGAHVPAFKKESERNERVVILIKTGIGLIKIVQIAGTIARRIIPYIKKGDSVTKGEKIGLIRLGSRVDMYLPSKEVETVVKVGDRIKAGVDTVAEIYG
jgi:phosphatidylserine decarboxylase